MFDELENIEVFKRTEDLGISVEYTHINLFFLMKKPSSGFRQVTAFAGGHTAEELLNILERVCIALQECSLNLSAYKTIIAPKDATIIGWHFGTIQASPHRIIALASC